jgi:hypothetical protein
VKGRGRRQLNRPSLAVNELAMNLPPAAVNDRYLKVLIIQQAAFAEVLCKLFAVLDSLLVILKDAAPVSHHIEKECSHYLASDTNPAYQESFRT